MRNYPTSGWRAGEDLPRNFGGSPWFLCGKAVLRHPVDVPATDWLALYIRLAEAEQSAFAFNAQCRAQACRLTVEQLLQIYRRQTLCL
ncbi:hypothetical protein [Pseudomonas sp. GWSMS-1]|uniref:hypothetical protein n=1 Tax=Pseudomonas sp. GWSMS-1 TaxID=3308997 RepID=UPI003CF4AC50